MQGLGDKECILWAYGMSVVICCTDAPAFVPTLCIQYTGRGKNRLLAGACWNLHHEAHRRPSIHLRKELTCMGAGMSCLVWSIQPLSSPVSFKITSCICYCDRPNSDITTVPRDDRLLCDAALLAPPPGFDLKREMESIWGNGVQSEVTIKEMSSCSIIVKRCVSVSVRSQVKVSLNHHHLAQSMYQTNAGNSEWALRAIICTCVTQGSHETLNYCD